MSGRLFCALALSLLIAAPAVAQTPPSAQLLGERTAEQRPALMVLGTAHLANGRHDVQVTDAGDILAPGKQAEIAAVVEALARWRPTRIAVEVLAADQAELDRRYAAYRVGDYALTSNEVDQIGLRLAARLGLERVEAVDWNDMPPGEEADYDWMAGAEAAGEQARLARLRDPAQGRATTDLMASRPIADWLSVMNSPDYMRASHARYYDFALLGSPELGQGANWVGAWHGRNLKIFANLVRLADRPDDRVLVIYGAGHAFLLNRFASESGAFDVESPVALLDSIAH